jgi:DNA mismatch repair protein MutS
VLANLEQAELNEAGEPRLAAGYPQEPGVPKQLDLFSSLPDPVIAELLDIDISRITPLEALNKLYEIQRRAGVNNKNVTSKKL